MKHATTLSTAAILLLLATSAVKAQTADAPAAQVPATPTSAGQVPADVQPGSWAYNAVQDLASKGLIAGYPPDGKFLGNRALTRYEMATIVSRILARLDQIAQSGANVKNLQQQIDEAKQLSDQYKVELTVIGTDMTQAKADIATLQQGLTSAYDAIEEQAKRTDTLKATVNQVNNTTYGSGSGKKFQISGYIQARAVASASSNHNRFPQGSPSVLGAYNGNYAQGGTQDSAEVRRARIKFSGSLSPNANYAAQLDFSGAVTPQGTTSVATPSGGTANAVTTTANQQVTVREAWAGYTFGDGNPAKNATVTAGLIANPFGYVLPLSSGTTLSPERPLAFNENGIGGPWASQDYDKGLKLAYGFNGLNLTYAIVNGMGRNAENIYSHFDSIYRAAYSVPLHAPFGLSVGASYYDGLAYRARPSSVPSPGTYPEPKKQLAGLDAQATYGGAFVDGEFMKGKYEQLSYFNESAAGATGPNGLTQNSYVPGNMIQGYYVWGGYTFSATGSRPLTLGADYDVFQRSTSAKVAGGGNSSYDDVNLGYGVLYNLDKAIRLRLWYDKPISVTHLTGTPDPPKIGLTTAEVQVKF